MKNKENKKIDTREKFFNIFGFIVIFSFLTIGIVLYLTGAHVFGKINKGGVIASYIFATLFLLIFILIIIKIFLILKSENKYAKRAVDVKKIFKDFLLNEEEKEINNLFNENFNDQNSSLNIYFGVFSDIENKYYKREVDINSSKVRMYMQKMIMDTTKEYGIFDVYLAIDFSKSINKKLIWKGDLKKYKTYFTYIREIFHIADDYIYDKYFINKPKDKTL